MQKQRIWYRKPKAALIEQKRSTIVAAARESFLESGYSQASMDGIARIAGALTDSRMLLSHPYLVPGGSPIWCATKIWQIAAASALTDEMRFSHDIHPASRKVDLRLTGAVPKIGSGADVLELLRGSTPAQA